MVLVAVIHCAHITYLLLQAFISIYLFHLYLPMAHNCLLLQVVVLVAIIFTTIGQVTPSADLKPLKQELQDTIREIQTYGEPPDFDSSLSETLLQLQQIQYPHTHILEKLEWYNGNDTLQRKLNVCIVVSSLEGLYINSGIGTAYYSLAHLLAKSGSSVTIIYTRDEPIIGGSFSYWVSYFSSYNITLKPLPPSLKRIASPKLQGRSYRLHHYLKQYVYDIVHFADFEGLGYYSTLAKRAGTAHRNTTLVVGLHGPTRWVADSNSNRKLLHESELEVDWMERMSVEYADVVWTPSAYLASWLANQSWILPSKLYLLPLPPGPEAALTITQSTSEKIQVKELVFFGRLESRKGLVLFCDALDLLAKMRSIIPTDFSVTFMGTLGYVDAKGAGAYIQMRASTWSFRFHIITNYNRTQALDYLRDKNGGRIAVIPSIVDNAPYTVYECLYLGIPFVATATPSIVPLVPRKYHADYLFEPKPYAMVRKLANLLRTGAGPSPAVFTASQSERMWRSFYSDLASAHVNPTVLPDQLPLVSVCITHFNRPALLKQALASIESQSYSNFEIIVVDDGSNSTEANRYLTSIEPYFLSKGWTIVRTSNNYLGAARNLAVTHAKGKYVLFLDDDNVAYPYQIATYVAVAEKTKAHVFTSAHAIFRGAIAPDELRIERYSVPLGPSLAVGLFKNCFGDANFFMLRDAFISSGGFTEDFGVGLEDHEFFATVVFNGFVLVLKLVRGFCVRTATLKNSVKIVFLLTSLSLVIPEPLLYYRIHDVSSQMVFTTDPRLGEARRLRPYIQALAEREENSEGRRGNSRSRRSMMELVARNVLHPREDCNQTLSSITPTDGPMSGGTAVTIRGAGFSCGVSSVRIGGQDCSGVQVISNSELTCLTPAGQSSNIPLDVTAEVSGASVVLYAAWTYLPLAAPQMTWCKLQDTGVSIACYFDSVTNQANATNCALYTNETLAKLGAQPKCYWVNPTTTAIDLGSGATITFNDQISIGAGVVRGQGSGGLPNQAASVALQKPDNPVHPVASIATPSNVGVCEGITLDGSGSTGGAGRLLNFTWALVSISPEPQQQVRSSILQTVQDANSRQLDILQLANSSISVHTTYSFSLVVANWLGQTDVSTVAVTKQDALVPQVNISGLSLIQIYRNMPLTLQGSVTGSTCGQTFSDSVVYKWSVSPSAQLDPSSVNTAILQVPASSLSAGITYQFTLLVTDSTQTDIQNSASVTVVVGLRDIVAKITGGNQQYAADDVIILDGSESNDPDDVAPLVFQWSCSSFYDSTVPCNVSLPADPKITVDAEDLGHGKWLLTLSVTSQSNNARYANASVYAEVADSVALSVSIASLNSSTVDPTQKLTLEAVLGQTDMPASEIEWSWSLVSGSLENAQSAYNTPLTSRILVINAGALTASTTYTYKVVATHSLSSSSGSASITFSVGSGPTAGGFGCPTSGSPDDVFTFDFGSLWTSTSGVVGYSLSFLPTDGSIEVPLIDSTLNTKVSTSLPTGSIKVVGYVYSGSGIAARQECPLILSYSDASQGLQSVDTQSKDQGITIYDIARLAYSAKSTYNQSPQGSAASLLADIRSTLLQQLQSDLSSVARTTNTLTAALGALLPLTDPSLGILSSSDLQIAISNEESLVGSESGTITDTNTLGANVEVLGNIVAQLNSQPSQNTNTARSVRSDSSDYWSAYARVVTLSSEVASLFMGQVSNGENALTVSRNNLAVSVYKNTAQEVDAQGFSIGSGNLPSLSLSPGFVPDASGKAQSIQFVYLTIGGSPYPVSSGLSLVSDVVILDVQADGQDVALVDLQPTARLSVPMNTNNLDNMQCMWYNESTWATAGCETQTSSNNIVCLCVNPTIMAVMHVDSEGAQTKPSGKGLSTTWIAVIAVVAGVAVIAIIIGVFVVKRRRSARRVAGATGGLPVRNANADHSARPSNIIEGSVLSDSPRSTRSMVDPEAVAAAVATAASLSPEGENSRSEYSDESWSSRYRNRTSSIASSASSPASSYRSGRSRTSSSSSEEEIMESEIKNIANELNKQLPRDTRGLEDIVSKMDME